MDEGGSVDEVSLSLEGLRGGGLGELLHWGPWRMRSECLWMRAFLSLGAPFSPRGTRHVGVARIPGTLMDV